MLDENRLLGHLRGLNQEQRVREFEIRAGKQLLVAMREATSGVGFDEIIKDEFESLLTTEVKLLYLCTALATDAGYRITEQQFVACAEEAPAKALHALRRNLVGIVIPTGPRQDLLLLRHRLIAQFVLDKVAAPQLVSAAYVRLLRVLAPEIAGLGRRSRTFGLYRELLNHKTLFYRFATTVDEARAIYDSIGGVVGDEFDYWLQYGLLELEFGNLELAENYLRQAESLYPKSDYVRNSIGHLILKKGIEAESLAVATQLRHEASELLVDQMANSDSPYPYHIYCSHRLTWARTWVEGRATLQAELEHLREVVKEGRKRYGRNRQLRKLEEQLDEEYMWLAVKREGVADSRGPEGK
ncbi:MAG: hypothetical protein V3U63_06165 [Gemmatimonadota bacterium]